VLIPLQKAEVESLKRQLYQAQSQSTKTTRRTSTASPTQSSSIDDLNAQVASKSATIESLELEISNLNKQASEQTNKDNELQSRISNLESSLQKAEQDATSTRTELSDLKANLEKTSEQVDKDDSDRDNAQTRIAQLEAELGAANRKASDSVSRAELLEKKIETLTQIHRDNDARNQTRVQEHKKVEREAAELRTRITGLSNENARLREAEQRRRKHDLGNIEDSSVQELLDEERDKLLAQLRSLEEENFELRRGVWKDRRTAMQPSIDNADPSQPYSNSGFDDIDLSNPSALPSFPSRGGPPPRHSSFQDVIQSGINAFTGQTNPHRRSDAASKPRPRQESLGSLDEFEIDEDAFRQAQEEESKKRIERVREVKRGLPNFKGWRADLVDVRVGMGGVFDI
jgi:myosin heavy subunit